MSAHDNMVSVTILDRNYTIKCPPEEAQALYQAANYLDAQMRKAGQATGNFNAEGLAVVAGLNVCHELMSFKKQSGNGGDALNQRVKDLEQRIEEALDVQEPVAV